MKSVQEQIESKCKYFNGLMNQKCNAGIKYSDVKVKDSKPIQIPCLKDTALTGGRCDSLCYPSEEEVKQRIDEIEGKAQMTIKARILINNDFEKNGERMGEIECPKCGGNLYWAMADLNNHVHAQCKCGFGFIE